MYDLPLLDRLRLYSKNLAIEQSIADTMEEAAEALESCLLDKKALACLLRQQDTEIKELKLCITGQE